MRGLTLPLLLALAACNSNSAPGNDREAQIDAAPTPAPRLAAAEALAGIATEAIALETMSDADIAALGGTAGRCLFRTTGVAFPSFLYRPSGEGAVKLNGQLISLPATGDRGFADAGLSVMLRPVEGEGNAGLREHELILMLPGAKDEQGYRGYLQCFESEEAP